MSNLEDEIEEASRGRKIPHDLNDKEELLKKKAAETQKSFDRVNADRDAVGPEAENAEEAD